MTFVCTAEVTTATLRALEVSVVAGVVVAGAEAGPLVEASVVASKL